MGGHVFICYDHEEGGDYVARLAAHLTDAGVQVWYDREIITGHRWATQIRDQIDTAAAFIAVMTPRGERSDWINREIDQAQQAQLPIFPLLLAGTRYFSVADLQYEDVTQGHMPRDEFVQRLRDLVTSGVQPGAAPASAAPAPQTVSGPPFPGSGGSGGFPRLSADEKGSARPEQLTVEGHARHVRAFNEHVGTGQWRYQAHVVSFTMEQVQPGGQRRSVYAEIRGQTIGRRPAENEYVRATGTYSHGRLYVESWISLGDKVPAPVKGRSWWYRHRIAVGVSAVVLVFATVTACVAPALPFANVFHGFPFSGSTFGGGGPTISEASGPAPWTISGIGYTYEFESITHTQSTTFMGGPAPSITITGHVTRTNETAFTSMSCGVRNESGIVLSRAPGNVWEESPALNERLPITIVVYDSSPAATTLTVTISDFFRTDQDLVLKDIPVPA
jgi:hypothetical protein